MQRGRKMNKSACLICLLCLLISCGPKQDGIEKIFEDGVEVVINHFEPYKIEGEPSELYLDEILKIDMEQEDISEQGLADVQTFDVDSEGNIFIFQFPRESEHLVFKFNKAGNFVMSFGEIGQGPGEIQANVPGYLRITIRNEIPIVDRTAKKILFFSSRGTLLQEIPFDMYYLSRGGFTPLENGNFLIHRVPLGPQGEIQRAIISIFDSGLNKIKDLADYEIPGMGKEKVNVFLEIPIVGISRNQIFLGYEKISKDILVYDLNGELKRIIRKEYSSIAVPDELKQEFKERFEGTPIWEQLYIPTHMPYFQYLFTDDEGRLYVVTFEKDKDSGMNICDIYNRDGIFIGRKSMGYYDLVNYIYLGPSMDIIAKSDRLYCLREKESGYKELMVYKMRWK